jgi:natural product biosynthesis luciferase-like monooxygenase protein
MTVAADPTLLDIFAGHVARLPDKRCMTFLENGEDESDACTYASLARDARAVAAQLATCTTPGDRALLLFPPGLDFVRAFLGCLAAGIVAVPAYPPRKNRGASRIDAIVADADARCVLTTQAVGATLPAFSGRHGTLPVLAVSAAADDAAPTSGPRITGDTLAFLQYTSGSTGTPKGVMVSHANLVHNLETIRRAFAMSVDSVFVGWLPVFHDMGLIGQVLSTLYNGATCVLMAPTAFLQRPMRWLEALSRYRGTIAGAPNSAYELCLARSTPAERAALDLSAWTMAYNGAEPVRADTVRRFADAFAPARLNASQLQPCYGMAESVLLVTVQGAGTSPVFHEQAGRELVSCGHAWDRATLRIVDPETRARCLDGTEGEIWIASPAIAHGYFNNPEASAAVFGARLADDDGVAYYRTGDLGMLVRGHLFITGRRKDLIIVHGRNLYPQDVEATAGDAVPGLRGDLCIAFGLDDGTGEQVVVVVELTRELMRAEHAGIIDVLRERVTAEHDVAPAAVVLVKTTTLPRTSSGKVQRQRCRQDFCDGMLDVVAQWRTDDDATVAAPAAVPDVATAVAPSAARAREALTEWLVQEVARQAGLTPSVIDPHAPFSRYGLDSVQSVALAGALQARLGHEIAPTVAYDHPSIASLAAHLTGGITSDSDAIAAGDRPTRHADPSAGDAIAIVGLALRVPGADSPAEFWSLLEAGRDAITAPPPDRDPTLGRGGYLRDVARFDAACFGISPHEAALMDPQQRLLCEVAWEALERAGIVPAALAGSRTGVYVGVSAGDYARLAVTAGATAEAHGATGNAPSIVANRLSYLFDLRGPSWAVDTACSSSLVAVHQGCEQLRAGAIDMALVGGVNVLLTPDLTTAFTRAGMLSPARLCRTFDAAADGYVRGEGALVLVLKRLADARRAGDEIWAVLRGSAVNQDGRTHGLTAPNGPAQTAVVREALARAGVAADAVQLVETHGTGTALGDPIEVQALRAALDGPRASPCVITSTKANIGHLEAAAGIAGLCKVVLAMRHDCIPPQPHLTVLNPRLSLGAALTIPREPTPWPAGRRIAGVSAFGFGGTNVHVVVESAPADASLAAAAPTARTALLGLSARTPAALQTLARQVAAWLAAPSSRPFAAIAQGITATRSAWPVRLAVVAANAPEAAVLLQRAADRITSPDAGVVLGDTTPLPAAERDGLAQFLRGEAVEWHAVYPDAPRVPDAPTYPFEAVRHWLPAAPTDGAGAPVTTSVIAPPAAMAGVSTPLPGIRFGVMFFAASVEASASDGYHLLIDVARYADQHGFSSVWLPERHFTALGGAYPAPAVLHAALAMCTERIRLHAGSVVAPLHHPVRLAEDWAVVDRLSNGRAGLSLATGWHPDDFALAPDRYAERQAHLYRALDALRALWRGDPWDARNGVGDTVALRTLPRPVQTECPVWITAATNPDSFERAGAAGANLLTHVLDQDLDALAAKIARYRAARAAAGHDPHAGQVAVMIHTFVGADRDAIREEARAPFCAYVEQNLGLLRGLAQSRGQQVDLQSLAPHDRAAFVNFLYDRFAEQRGLIGTPESCLPLVQQLEAIGVNEIACLLDFGPTPARVRDALPHLDRLRQLAAAASPDAHCYTRMWSGAQTTRQALASRVRLLSDAPEAPLATAVRVALEARGLALTTDVTALTVDLRAGEAAGENVVSETHRLVCGAMAIARDASAPVVFVTRGAVRTETDDQTPVHPPAAAVWGVARALQVERPGRLALLLDLDASQSVAAQAAALVETLLAPPADDMVAIRGRAALVPRLVRTTAPRGRAVDTIDGRTVLITGGTGGLGLALARTLLDHGVRDIALVARHAGADHTASLDALRSHAASCEARVTTHALDVADCTMLAGLFDALRDEGRAVGAIYHTAGLLDDARLADLDDARIARVLSAKVDGGWYLRELAAAHDVKLLVFFSSVSAILPAPGQAAYAAANAFLDALALDARAAGLNAHSINWGPWAEVGHAATAYGRAAHAQLASLGMRPIALSLGLEVLRRVSHTAAQPLVVADVRWPQVAQADPQAAQLGLLRELITTEVVRESDTSPTPARYTRAAATRSGVVAPPGAGAPTAVETNGSTPVVPPTGTGAIPAGSPSERRAWLFAHLAGAIAGTLKYPADKPIPPRQPLFDLGLDSILALELRDRLERELGLGLAPTILFTYPTLEALVDHLVTGLTPAGETPPSMTDIGAAGDTVGSPASAATPAETADASQDIEVLLRQALAQRSAT